MMSDLALEIRRLTKRFGGNQALAEVDLQLRRGEIHALLGENGAGKSTLIKILAGAIQPDDGEILIGGGAMPSHHSPSDAARAGLAFVHQDLGLIDSLSVAENIALELGYSTRRGLISFGSTERHVAALLAQVGVDIASQALVGDLAQDQKVMVAVTRAVSKGAAVVVLDEVSSSLPAPEMARLATSLRAAQRTGIAYIYVTHRLEEVFDLADRVTVLRDGQRVATAEVATTTHSEIVEWIVGDSLEPAGGTTAAGAHAHGATLLRVQELASPGLAEPISFEIAAGEVLGLCGLIGSGSREVARLLGGAATPSGGGAKLGNQPLPLGDPYRLARAGCAYVPGDRAAEGAIPEMSIRENLFLARKRTVSDSFVRAPRRERKHASALVKLYDVRPPGAVEQPLSSLSGGNQQKVILARALRGRPQLIVLDDPTAGVDVGARVQLHGFLRQSASQGTSVLLASTDFEEVASQCDRVLIMRHGRVDQELTRHELTADRLARASYGTTPTKPQMEIIQ